MKNHMSFHLKCLKMCVDLPFVVAFAEHGGFLNFRKSLGFGKERCMDETIGEL